MAHQKTLEKLVPQYVVGAKVSKVETLHGGLINATYLITLSSEKGEEHLVLQRVNTAVFNKPELVMGNSKKVTQHLKEVAPSARNLKLEPTLDGAHYMLDGKGGLWRAFNYLEDCIGHEQVETTEQAYEAGCAFGMFLRQMDGLEADTLEEIIPNFHDTPKRLEKLEKAVEENRANRAGVISRQLEFIEARKSWISKIETLRASGEIPTRTTHNDTKISNVLFDAKTDKAVCVIDLDTVMPGSMLYDFGDLVRTSINSVPEDASEDEVTCRLDIFKAITKGYLKAAQGTLCKKELELLVFSAKLITLELAMRFLTDYLNGDVYFRVERETQNLERARNQLRLVELIEENEVEMDAILKALITH